LQPKVDSAELQSGSNWPSNFKGEDFCKKLLCTKEDGRMTAAK
jgi:hypothetical protein